jgi:hypothetical protein
MGDRVTCTMYLRAPLSEAMLGKVTTQLGEPDEDYGPLQMVWYEVNYGSLGETLEDDLVAHQVAFAWSHEAGGGFGAMVTFNDPEVSDQGAVTYGTMEGQIALTVDMAENRDKVRRARVWSDWWDTTYDMVEAAAQLTGAST